MDSDKQKQEKQEDEDTRTTSEKPISLFPVEFRDALKELLDTKPKKLPQKNKKSKTK